MSGVSGDGFRMGDSGAVSWTGRVMVAAIIVLFVAVVFVIFLHLYARWFWRRNDEATRRRRRHFVFNTDVDITARRGLDTAVIQSLPVLIYQSAEFKDGLECSVCLCELADGEKARVLPKCNHGFHLECIDMWFQSHSTCPLCRSLVGSEDSPPSAASGGDGEGVTAETFAFPTNVLFWGRPEGEDANPSSSSSSARSHPHIVIDIPRPVMDGSSTDAATSNVSPSSGRVVDELKSPTSRLDSLKRLLSREGRLAIPLSPRGGGGDVEQGSRGSMEKP